MSMPIVDWFGHSISRLIVGGNTISGFSHMSPELNAEMEDYFTTERVLQLFDACEKQGITTMQLRGDKHILRLIREYRLRGGKMEWIAQTTPEIGSFERNIASIMAYKPAMIYHHGVHADTLFLEGRTDELLAHLEVMRATGCPVGLGTHMPQLIEYAERNKWPVDFYMACAYNISKPERKQLAAAQKSEDPLFDEGDPPLMYAAIRATQKPVLLFKILGASRRCASQETVRAAFCEAFAGIKPSDCVVVGMFPKYADQVALNAQYTAEATAAARAR